ncbi:hypothetical protein BDL97_16G036700 [Sphagnum fallax]|nr:hypothetical protein BDL97_16G036700 [Sphagnum fallax]KAH8937606.1 hypothetical protein BDL97_16G036700 [Sphagnum fallax]KAH8937607.1 hypothetical protein BDL97_16G036700 [Sphagnum fallax]KAH8937612.1 hypothetical protein BDL97_16G036700 [Sphagnum fallax]
MSGHNKVQSRHTERQRGREEQGAMDGQSSLVQEVLDVGLPSSLTSPKESAIDYLYTACYCEENVYMLCKRLCQLGLAMPDASDLFVVFISNSNCKVPLWRQKSKSSLEEGFCIWDYHVICIQKNLKGKGSAQVWDLDSTLPFPTSLDQYVSEALRPWAIWDAKFFRLYRVVAVPMYLQYFASDRRHMKGEDGDWRATPPLYDCIVGEDGAIHNLEEYIRMKDEQVLGDSKEALMQVTNRKFGVLLSEDGLLHLFA